MKASTAEHARLAEATGRAESHLFSANPWYEWGPYLSERAWGTVREDCSAEGVGGATIDYQTAESTTAMFGGNSNWHGPVWLPLNYLAIRKFVRLHRVLGDDLTLEYRTGSGSRLASGQVAQDLADRILAIWVPDSHGVRPVFKEVRRMKEYRAWKDDRLFFEYFHGDNGAGLGTSHQTRWTALVVDLILDPPGACPTSTPTTSQQPHHGAAPPNPE